jgi:hypothetical protein
VTRFYQGEIVAESKAQVALRKARYFLLQARKEQDHPAVLNDRLPFTANMEAAIVYARASIEHLKSEFAAKYNDRGYRRWHDDTWRAYAAAGSAFGHFYERRNYILHQEPESTSAQVNVEIAMSVAASVEVSYTVIRADKKDEVLIPDADRAAAKTFASPTSNSAQSQHFFFNEKDWRNKSAVDYIDDFISSCEKFVADAEKQFS